MEILIQTKTTKTTTNNQTYVTYVTYVTVTYEKTTQEISESKNC